ncbi:response regulator [Parabacteroides sp. OttesenSCG-928-G07]|nr:response regulator [Parabacteroides sp. OttesenSCG-928-G07]
MRILKLLSLLLLLLCSIGLHAKTDLLEYKFNHIDAEKGLSNNEVKYIFKDSNGFMWFGTPSGLNRFDGYDVLRVNQNLSEIVGSANNDIEKIQESEDGKLWLKTAYGYTIYDLKKEAYINDISPVIQEFCGREDFSLLYIDKGKNHWFVTPDDVRFYNIKTHELKILPRGGADQLSQGNIIDIKQGNNRYRFLFENGLLECVEAETYQVVRSEKRLMERLGGSNFNMRGMYIDSSFDIWVYNLNADIGVAWLNIAGDNWEYFSTSEKPSNYISNNVVFALTEDNTGMIWAGTDHGGITLINKKERTTRVLEHKDNDPLSLPENSIKCLYSDNLGIIWAGTYKQGIGYYHANNYRFGTTQEQTPMPYEDVNCFIEDPKGNVWIGTNGGGLIYYDPQKDSYTQYLPQAGNPYRPSGNVIVSMEYDADGNLWIGYYLAGMDKFDGRTFTNFKEGPDEKRDLTSHNVWALRHDRNGNMWVGTLSGGLLRYDPKTGERKDHFETNGAIYDIIEKRSGEILIGTQNNLFAYSPSTGKMTQYEREIFTEAQVGRHDINSLHEDSRGLVWVGTRNGLFSFNPYSKVLNHFTPDNGLAADLIQEILEDEQQNIWVSTNRGISCINVYTESNTPGYFYHINNFDQKDGLQGQQFNKGAGLITRNSEMIFGGVKGFNLFTPSEIINSAENPKVVLTEFQLSSTTIKPETAYNGRIILTESISLTQDIQLRYSNNIFSLSFAAQDYYNSGRARYFYMLEGFNNNWLEADRESRKVTYTNLNPGKYVFHLKAVSNDFSTTEHPITLHITISPPFWRTGCAWIIYILLFIGILFIYWRFTVKESEKKLAYAREKLQTIQQHQLHEMKLRFFTNISHEFRTPLTLIITPLEGLLKNTTNSEDKVTLSIIHRNALQLLQLVNQLLDFRKLDAKGHTLNKSLLDMSDFIREQSELFSEAMTRKNIKFSVITNPHHLYMWFDPDKMSKVFVNLLFNAHKFTQQGGNIELAMNQEKDNKIRITVTDDGIGIPEDALDKIFDRFYQVKQSDSVNTQEGGSGIGLHLAKEFVTLHGGEMWAENVPNGGSRFVIILPNIEENPIVEGITKENVPTFTGITGNTERHDEEDYDLQKALLTSALEEHKVEKPKLLIVDDNDDFRLYLAGNLKEQYLILEAPDGVSGLELALQEIPDMILTDVMMPQMDGIQMSKHLKEDIRTSHIPIILLTAKSGEESKLEGLSAGADDYITKPFNMEILMVKMHNLVEKGKQRRITFNNQIKIEPSKIAISSVDEKLISKALLYTEANISNPDFSVEELSRELGMSRVHLYKKLTSLTGKSPIEFIRVVRLKRAAQLLEESQLSVSEIAFEVGFNNPKYFRKYFKDEFGILPSQYGKNRE